MKPKVGVNTVPRLKDDLRALMEMTIREGAHMILRSFHKFQYNVRLWGTHQGVAVGHQVGNL